MNSEKFSICILKKNKAYFHFQLIFNTIFSEFSFFIFSFFFCSTIQIFIFFFMFFFISFVEIGSEKWKKEIMKKKLSRTMITENLLYHFRKKPSKYNNREGRKCEKETILFVCLFRVKVKNDSQLRLHSSIFCSLLMKIKRDVKIF